MRFFRANERSKGEGKGKEEEGKGRGGKGERERRKVKEKGKERGKGERESLHYRTNVQCFGLSMRFLGPLMVINHPPDEVIGSCRLKLVSASTRPALCHGGSELLIRVNGGGSPTISMHDSMVVVWDTPV